jgi:hypothetical protein
VNAGAAARSAAAGISAVDLDPATVADVIVGDLVAILRHIVPANVAVAVPWAVVIVARVNADRAAVRLPVAMQDASVVLGKIVSPRVGMTIDLNPDDEIA